MSAGTAVGFYGEGSDMDRQPNKDQSQKCLKSQNKNEKRAQMERRQKDSCGFAYISTVGWICRRERSRRKDDPDPC